MFETPNSSISYDNQQDVDEVSHFKQRISKLEAVISKLLNINIESLEATNIECSLPNISTGMWTLEKMVHERVQSLQFNEKEQNCVKLANPPLKLPIKRKTKKRKNAVFSDLDERDITTVSKSIEIATSNDVTNAERFNELL